MSNQQFTVKVFRADDTKKFKLPSLSIDDLEAETRKLTWSEALPQVFKYYHVQDNLPIVIDDQEAFRNAVFHNVQELNSHVMRLYVAEN